MVKQYEASSDSWDYLDEDNYPSTGFEEAEYIQDVEDEDEEYYHGYAPIQGTWYLDEYEDEGYDQKRGRRMRIRSVKSYDEARDKERKKNQKKIRSEAKAREKQRQAYYHYGDEDEE